MENLFKLLIYLFLAVAVMVFVLGRMGSPINEEQQAKLSRFILPLVALLIVVQLISYLFK